MRAGDFLSYNRGNPSYGIFNYCLNVFVIECRESLVTGLEIKNLSVTASVCTTRAEYLAAKAAQAEAKKEERRKQKMAEETARLEAELEEVEAELNGSAASDYMRAAELDARKTEIEDRLMELYELQEI